MSTIFIYILLALLSFVPIVIWAYSFSFIDNNPLNRKRFLFGTLAWILSVFPILNMERIIDFLQIKFLNAFWFAHEITDFFSSLKFALSLGFFLVVIAIFSFLFWWFIWNKLKIVKIYFKNLLVFIFCVLVLSSVLYLLNGLNFLNFNIETKDSIGFWEIIFNTFKLIVFYYLIVAFIEESAKHFNFLQSSVLTIKSIKEWVLDAIFVALWFSFVENLLYLAQDYEQYWITFELVKTYFFRSTFSIIVHILSSSVIAYYFSKAIILYRNKDLSFPYLKLFFFGLIISILLHLTYDVSIQVWLTLVIFLYFIGGYLYVSSIFYKE